MDHNGLSFFLMFLMFIAICSSGWPTTIRANRIGPDFRARVLQVISQPFGVLLHRLLRDVRSAMSEFTSSEFTS
jgi:hypothetical protein